ncbi:MAG: RrF2 family transcriptional regulator [Niabella sp.]
MLLSHTCQVALKAVLYIATQSRSVTVKELSQTINESTHTIAKVLQSLVKQGQLTSITGPAGGFFITEEQSKNSILEIIKSVDGKDVLEKCVLGLKQCSSQHPCPVHAKFVFLREEITNIFEKTTITNIGQVLEKGNVFLN